MHHDLIIFVLVNERSNSKLTVADLNGALEKKKDGRCVKHVYISKANEFDVLVHHIGMLLDFS